MNKKIIFPFASLLFCGVLFLIWPTAHTIALRKLLLALSAVIGLALWIRSAERNVILKQPWIIFLALLFVWVAFHVAFISQNGAEAWQEFVGQWIPAYLAIFSGIGLALASQHIKASIFKPYLLIILATHPILFVFTSIYKSIQLGNLAIGFLVVNLGMDLKPSLTFSSDLLAAVACAKLVEPSRSGTKNIPKFIWILSIVLAMYIAVFAATLNSILLISICIFIVMIIFGYRLKKIYSRIIVAFLILIMVMAVYVVSIISRDPPNIIDSITSVKTPNYCGRIVSNTKVALSIDQYNNWTNYYKLGIPSNELGEQLPESFYLHVAYARAGLRAALENPMGYGVTRHALERIVQQKYPDARIASTHNGYLDLACAVGIPGLLLFLLALIAIFKQLSHSRSEFARPGMWMIGMYALHWMLDPLSRDHFFELYLFIIALMMTLAMITAPQNTIPDNQVKAL